MMEQKVLEYISSMEHSESILKIIESELSRGNTVIEFIESVEKWDNLTFIMFKDKLAENYSVSTGVRYQTLDDPHWWANEYRDVDNKILVCGNKNNDIELVNSDVILARYNKDTSKYTKIILSSLLVFFVGLAAVFVGNTIRDNSPDSILAPIFEFSIFGFAIVSLLIIGLNFKFLKSYDKLYKLIKDLEKKPVIANQSTVPNNPMKMDFSNGKGILYISTVLFLLLEFFVDDIDVGLPIRLSTLILFIVLIESVLIDAKFVPIIQKVLLLIYIPLYIFVIESHNNRLDLFLLYSWVTVSGVVLIFDYLKFYYPKQKRYKSRLFLLLAFNALMLLSITREITYFNTNPLIGKMAIVTFTLTIIVTYILKRFYSLHINKVLAIAFSMFLLTTTFTFILTEAFNYILDDGEEYIYNAEIVDKIEDVNGAGETHYYLKYYMFEERRIYVTYEEYVSTEIGFEFDITYYKGFFGLEYILPNQNEFIQNRE